MVSADGYIGKEAFPVDELIEKDGKSVSVDRKSMMKKDWIRNKLVTYERPLSGRAAWGYANAKAADIELVLDEKSGVQVFSVFEDPLVNFPPAPWDGAHAKIVRADPSYGKGFVRGFRDKLVEIFQCDCEKLT